VLISDPKPLRLRDISEDPRSVGFPSGHPPMHSFLGAPIKVLGKVFGNIYLTEKRGAAEFSPEDEGALVVLAAQAGVAIESARAHRNLERLALLEERERIAKELHDGAIQALFAVGMELQATAGLADAPVRTRLEKAVAEVDHVIGDLRSYIFGLRPGILAGHHLHEALTQLASETRERSDVMIVTDVDIRAAERLAGQAPDLVQLAREALSNVVRHAGAATCRMSLRMLESQAFLEIDDDGRGFDPGAVSDGGQGLINIRHRASSMGAEVQIESKPGQGTTLRVVVPL
jgi:signal transduction histidine kinase